MNCGFGKSLVDEFVNVLSLYIYIKFTSLICGETVWHVVGCVVLF